MSGAQHVRVVREGVKRGPRRYGVASEDSRATLAAAAGGKDENTEGPVGLGMVAQVKFESKV